MLIKENLFYFLKTGCLKHIHYNINRNQLTQLIGESTSVHFSSPNDKNPTIYKYGRIEFYFEHKGKEAKLNGIIYQAISNPAEHGLLQCNYKNWSKNLDIEKAKEQLIKNNIQFKEIADKFNHDTKYLLTEGNVNIYFVYDETKKKYLLFKAGNSIKLDKM